MAKQTLESMSIPEAGWEFYGIGPGASYEAAKRGEIPFIKVGRLKRVPRRLMEAKMQQPDSVEDKS
jgi:hypothetical protein